MENLKSKESNEEQTKSRIIEINRLMEELEREDFMNIKPAPFILTIERQNPFPNSGNRITLPAETVTIDATK